MRLLSATPHVTPLRAPVTALHLAAVAMMIVAVQGAHRPQRPRAGHGAPGAKAPLSCGRGIARKKLPRSTSEDREPRALLPLRTERATTISLRATYRPKAATALGLAPDKGSSATKPKGGCHQGGQQTDESSRSREPPRGGATVSRETTVQVLARAPVHSNPPKIAMPSEKVLDT